MITIITSFFKGDNHIKYLLENVTLCNNYSKCEHLIFNIINSNTMYTNRLLDLYSDKFKNIKIIKITKDPGLYEIWNMGIKMAQHDYLLTLNIDDLISKSFLNLTYNYLNINQNINLVCTPVIVSHKINTNDFDYKSKTMYTEKKINNKSIKTIEGIKYDIYPTDKELIQQKFNIKELNLFNKDSWCRYNYFDKYDMVQFDNNIIDSYNIPHCCPVWRKSLHNKYGYFDEKIYGPYADYEFWLRCMDDSTIFGLIDKVSVIYYLNPYGHNSRNSDSTLLNKIFYKYYGISNIKSIGMNYVNFKIKKQINFDIGKQYTYNFGKHRAGWYFVLENIYNNTIPKKGSIYLDTWIESTFIWGKNKDKDNFTYNYPWIGILHNPINIPKWFNYNQSLYTLCKKDNFIKSLQYCKKIYVLSKYLADKLKNNKVIKKYNIKVDYFYHPSEIPNIKFNFEKFIKNKEKKILQIGWWLRELHMIYILPVIKNYTKHILCCGRDRFKYFLNREKKFINKKINYFRSNVNYMTFINNSKYDELLSCNIIFLYLYDTSANNIVIECISRNTPILVNKVGGIVEYLGEEYPFYYNTIEEACDKLINYDLIKKTHEYLKTNKKINDQINMTNFINNIDKYINPF
jgi:hypothetical protein